MKVLFLLPYPLGRVPGQRYRVEQWAPCLRESGVECDLFPLLTLANQHTISSDAPFWKKFAAVSSGVGRCLERLPRLRQYDVVWVYRTALLAGPPVLEWLIGHSGPPLVYEFDDAIWLTKNLDANRAWGFLKCSWKTKHLCRMATQVVVGSDNLAHYARRFNRRVTVIPSTVDVDHYPPRKHPETLQPVVIGWSGSPTTVEDLSSIERALRRVAAETRVEFRLMGGEVEFPGLPMTARPWSLDREVEELRGYDIGIMPLPNDPWRQGKCGMKALLYMSVGVPAVVSPVGLNTAIIQDGVNGFLAADEDEWVEKLLRLIRDVKLRRELGAAGRRTVESHYSSRAQVPQVLEVLRRAAGHRAGGKASDGALGEVVSP
jgi:glycosyltransferase involved in cell wall biosynthesis